jgi:phosphoribosylformimino-5-aminoimidazole carboxamide ribonucleotide (ProFAR) isomerase
MAVDLGDFGQFLLKIQTQYPQALSILSQPGVMEVYRQAIDGSWSPERLQAALQTTPWWTQSNASQRQWQALQATDPATAAQKVEQTQRIIADLSKELGVNLQGGGGLNSPDFAFLRDAVTNGWDSNEIRYRLLQSVNTNGSWGGLIATSAAQVKSMANDYAVPLSDQSVMEWGKKLAQGAIDQQGMQGYLIEAAKSMFPALTKALDAGVTVKQYAEPYLQLATQELGVNPASINLTDQKWLTALNQVDPKTGQRVAMSLDTWLAKIRTDAAYGYDTTEKGRADATTLATQLQQKFGNAA